MKPGYQTSEFWITVVLSVLATIAAMLPEGSTEARVIMAILAGAAAMGYTVSRGMVKAAEARRGSGDG